MQDLKNAIRQSRSEGLAPDACAAAAAAWAVHNQNDSNNQRKKYRQLENLEAGAACALRGCDGSGGQRSRSYLMVAFTAYGHQGCCNTVRRVERSTLHLSIHALSQCTQDVIALASGLTLGGVPAETAGAGCA